MQDPPITARHFAFHWTKSNVTQAVFYWRESMVMTSNTTSALKIIQISLSIYPNSTQPEQIQQVEATLQRFGETVATYWQPIRTWAPVALVLSRNADILAEISAAGLVLVIAVTVLKNVQRNNRKKGTYAKISEQNKKIVAAVNQTQRQSVSTVGNIAFTYQALYKQSIDQTLLVDRLESLSQVGVLYPEIRNIDDGPLLVWKTLTQID